MNYLADVNLWIALVADQHVHHPAASRWFRSLGDDKLAFCRITQMGFQRLLTNKGVMQEEVVSPGQAWETYRALRSDWGIQYLAEPTELAELWCAFVHAAGLTLVTFDSRMPKRPSVVALCLSWVLKAGSLGFGRCGGVGVYATGQARSRKWGHSGRHGRRFRMRRIFLLPCITATISSGDVSGRYTTA
jgi:predicted nucleic acid-binding protein